MSATKHTPGPWRIGDHGRTVFGPPNGHPSPETVAQVTHKKNALLIAAAPDLLAAVKMVLDASEDGGDMENIDWGELRAVYAQAAGQEDDAT